MSLLEQFDFLRNSDPRKRLAATLKIFEILDIPAKPVSEVSSVEDLEVEYGTDTQYTFTRLIRGLASSRESARLGFSAALSELLRALPKIDITMVLNAIEKATTPAGNIKGQETRDYQFGRLFGLQALCTSGLLVRTETTFDEVTPIFGLLFELAMSKGWLRESCANVMLQVLDSMVKTNSPLSKDISETVLDMLYTAELSRTMEGIAIALKCKEIGATRTLEDWAHGDILHSDNLKAINKILRDLNPETEAGDGDKQTGTWKPKLHFSWLLITQAIINAKSEQTIEFSSFWKIVVDEGLFSTNSSHERKFWGFQLFNTLVHQLEADQLSILFSPNFLRTLGNQIVNNDRYLNKAAKSTTASMVSAAEADHSKCLPILTVLWEFNLFFDRLSKDKTCELIMLNTRTEDVDDLIALLISHCNVKSTKANAEITTKEVEKRRQFVADAFLHLLRSNKVEKVDSWVEKILAFMTINGFFKVSKPKKNPYPFTPDLSDSSRDMLKSRLQSALGCLMHPAVDSSTTIYSSFVVQTIEEYRTKKYFDLVLKPDETILALLDSTNKKLTKLAKWRLKKSTQDQALAFTLLYSLTTLQVYAGEGDAVQVLEDLEDCFTRVFAKNRSGTEESDEDTMALLVDLLLGFLSRESVLFRKLVDSVFNVFAQKLTPGAIELLLNVLQADESGQGLFDKAGAAEGASDGDNEDDEMNDEDDAASSSSESGSDAADREEMPEDDDKDAALDAALMAALGGKKRKAAEMESGEGHESDFEPDEDDEEELMDDDQMLAMDATLEGIFKARKQETSGTKRQDKEDLKTSTIQLKRKVLDLLEIFIKVNPTSLLILELIIPVIQAGRKSSDPQFTEKAQNLIRQKLTKSKTLPVINEDMSEIVLQQIRDVHNEASHSLTPPQLMTCSQSSLFLVRLLLTKSSSHLLEIAAIYTQSQITWINKKNSKFTPGFFVDFINWANQWRVNQYKIRSAVEDKKNAPDEVPVDVESEEPAEIVAAPAAGTSKKSKKSKKQKVRA